MVNSMKKHYLRIALALLLTAVMLAAAACSSNPGATQQTALIEPDEPLEPVATQTQLDAGSPAVPAATAPAASQTDEAAVKEAYRAALNTFMSEHVFPDGIECAFDSANDISGDSFAIFDVDGDGRDELIIVHIIAPMAGQTQYVLDYDVATHKFVVELSEFPALTFYDNGVVKAEWSHNQGLGGDFWPFTAYKYDQASDTYKLIGMIDAWDKNMTDGDGDKYPVDIDVSGTGFVYYIMTNGEYEKGEPVDVTEFNEWYAENLGNGLELEITYREMTAENIAGIQ